LSESDLARLFRIINDNLVLSQLIEFTVEANPGTLTNKKISILKNASVSRISLGAQSFNTDALKTLGRIHTDKQTEDSFNLLRKGGFENISLDLIFAIPGTTVGLWEEDIRRAVALKPQHISTYCLTYEKKTPLTRKLKSGDISKLNENIEAKMYKTAVRLLAESGYRQYEISNFALPSFECRHNLNTWGYFSYVGLGPAAASFIDGARMINVSNIEKYCSLIKKNKHAVTQSESLLGKRKAGEVLMLSLRKIRGITECEFKKRTGLPLIETFGKKIEEFRTQKLISLHNKRLRLTKRAFLVADSILSDFIE
ncbi:MAG: radical SAM family heme chaperone HemW, partial [Planctomycetota bacterium]